MHHKVAIFISETRVILEEEGPYLGGRTGIIHKAWEFPIIEVAKRERLTKFQGGHKQERRCQWL